MSSSSKYELDLIIVLLLNINHRLSDITEVISSSGANIGNDLCADCVKRVIENYTTIIRNLNNLDTTRTKDETAASSSLYTRA